MSGPDQTALEEKALRDLQWTEVLARIAARCHSESARAALVLRVPLSERELAQREHQLVAEALFLLRSASPLPVRRFETLTDAWAMLQRGAPLGGGQLRDVADLLDIAERLQRHLAEHARDCPVMKQTFWVEPTLRKLSKEIRSAIDEAGQVRDQASEGLAAARRQLQKTRRDLKNAQQSLLDRYGAALSGRFFAERDGRFVLPVRSDASTSVDGLVLGSSGSGGTLYVEPRELTALNNRWHIDEAKVQQEEAKVLAALSDSAVRELSALRAAEQACVHADQTQAVAEWALVSDAFPVEFSEQCEIHLVKFRHPLLLDQEQVVIANDLALHAGQCLIISGPNAGGKTVAMKCLGLSVWMARAGLPLPCAPGSRMGWFEQVFSDIGDEQSLSRSLSTFSAHITNIAQALDEAKGASLVLLDELASGTDPDEGSALAVALLHAFVERGAAVCVTTHYERLKLLGASEDERFQNASVGFDLEKLRPTFRLALGSPGASSAFAVAARYGVPGSVIEHARSLLPKTQLEQQRVIEQLEEERRRLAEAREQSEAEVQAQTRLRRQLEAERTRAYEQEKRRIAEAASSLTQEVKLARSLLQRAKKALADEKPDRVQVKEAEHLVNQAAQPVTLEGTVTSALRSSRQAAPVDPTTLEVGSWVYLPHLDARAEVVELPKKGTLRVLVGGLRLSVPLDRVQQAPSGGGPPKRNQKTKRPRRDEAKEVVTPTAAAVRTSFNTCDLRGVRVEAGLDQLDAFIDRMLRGGESTAFVLHGHGTGAMKAAVREHLGSSRHVTRFEPASREDGGDALTLFWLRD